MAATVIPLQAAKAATPEIISSLISQDQYVAGVENSLIRFSVTLSGRDAASTASTKLVITRAQSAILPLTAAATAAAPTVPTARQKPRRAGFREQFLQKVRETSITPHHMLVSIKL